MTNLLHETSDMARSLGYSKEEVIRIVEHAFAVPRSFGKSPLDYMGDVLFCISKVVFYVRNKLVNL